MAHLESLVVLDPSPRTRSALAFGFERAGYSVYATAEGADALAMAQTRVPQLVVASMHAAVDGGDASGEHEALSLVGRLREESATRELPIVVLGEREAREPALRAGADEFVARPAFIRDVLTLARLAVALRQDGDDSGVAGLLEDYGLYFLTRALAVAGRTGVLELERGRRAGEVRLVQGEVVAARVGRMSGVAAFHHLLLWGEASLHLRFETPAGERKINAPIEELLSAGASFAREFEALSGRIGGVQAVFRQEPRRAAEARGQIPAEVMGLVKHFDGQRPFIDVVEDSGFKPLDTIKITFRLQQLGVIERVQAEAGGESPLTAQLAVRDWLLGAATESERSTVTEAGRRAAEAYAEAAARKAAHAPEEEILDDTQKVRTAAAAAAPALPVEDAPTAPREAERGPQARNKRRKRRDSAPEVKHDTAPTPKVEAPEKHDTDRTPKVEPQAAAPARVDDDATIPFTKLPFDVLEAVKADLAPTPPVAKPAPVAKSAPPAIPPALPVEKPVVAALVEKPVVAALVEKPAAAPVEKPAAAPVEKPAAAAPAVEKNQAPVAAPVAVPSPVPAARSSKNKGKPAPAARPAPSPGARPAPQQLHRTTGPTPKLTEPKQPARRADHNTNRPVLHDPSDPAFSDFEEQFFASATELAKIHPVETFDDLEPKNKSAKRRWFGFGGKLDSAPKSPKKR